MAVRGRHRRYQPSRVNRASLTVTASGAGLALPLIGATTAQAAGTDIWNKVAACESSSNWHINTGNGFYGGLQFTQSTWDAYGGRVYAVRADRATKDQQVAVAERVLDSQGPGAWPACGERAGLTRGAEAPHPSTAAPAHQHARPVEQGRRPAADVQPQTPPQSRAGTAETYKVVRGDSLSAIAEDRDVDGGWQRLYAANRTVVGSDPDLILPGQRLVVDGSGHLAAPHHPAAPPAPKPSGKDAHQPHQPSRTRPAPQKTDEHQKPDRPAQRGGHADSEHAHADGRPAKHEPAKHEPAKHEHAKSGHAGSGQQHAQHRPPSSKAAGPAAKPAAKTPHKPSGAATHHLFAPVHGGVGTPYHESGSSWSKGYHTGIDFLVPTGTSVKAIAQGEVVAAGWGGSYGYQVVIRHTDGKYSQYAHLSAISVKSGQRIVGGQRIGRSGATGNVTGPHLHFEVRTGPGFGSDINPLAYLRAGGVRM